MESPPISARSSDASAAARRCNRCGEWKPLTADHWYRKKQRNGKRLLAWTCIPCDRERVRNQERERRETEGIVHTNVRVDEEALGALEEGVRRRGITKQEAWREAIELWLRREATRERLRYGR